MFVVWNSRMDQEIEDDSQPNPNDSLFSRPDGENAARENDTSETAACYPGKNVGNGTDSHSQKRKRDASNLDFENVDSNTDSDSRKRKRDDSHLDPEEDARVGADPEEWSGGYDYRETTSESFLDFEEYTVDFEKYAVDLEQDHQHLEEHYRLFFEDVEPSSEATSQSGNKSVQISEDSASRLFDTVEPKFEATPFAASGEPISLGDVYSRFRDEKWEGRDAALNELREKILAKDKYPKNPEMQREERKLIRLKDQTGRERKRQGRSMWIPWSGWGYLDPQDMTPLVDPSDAAATTKDALDVKKGDFEAARLAQNDKIADRLDTRKAESAGASMTEPVG
ncbi:hypothetical protein EJ06DRAFT_534244 [Trichodelitschia bisporula]|uniref:Uncharacterized protein n=1 Tax=Trichodelitschia bisporula TaxID=703511 RepID=A0A6G1HJE4_9PEZI|nr:hypothetical protein EJ06DRAFT_534244 [Trichodelitschia bisporula]